MDIKTEPHEIAKEYEDDKSFKSGLDLYETVKRNNNFYHGRQWEGLNAPAIEKPVFNVIKPSVNYLTSMLVTDDIGVKCEFAKNSANAHLEEILQKLSKDDSYGMILRSKGILQTEDGSWVQFDLVPGEYEIREGSADYTGRICVIGSKLKEDELEGLFF